MSDIESREDDRLINNNQIRRPSFKCRKSLSVRKEEVEAIRCKFPNKIPVIVERYSKEKSLPEIDKVKFLVPMELTLSQLANILRIRLQLTSTQAFFLFVSNGHMPALSSPIAQLHKKYEDEDGFLYVTYASQESFGCQHRT
eukprot:TRINITY_DN22275_c0_g1_i1.p1 TRINITY_DN22275_c0_g1~~TRINITY_DN22275_c0_g1_i1.p1  ORF type:complete len:154 (-),score=28.15 TRINITY_DN22275_c0_g1_i1:128-553(-)